MTQFANISNYTETTEVYILQNANKVTSIL